MSLSVFKVLVISWWTRDVFCWDDHLSAGFVGVLRQTWYQKATSNRLLNLSLRTYFSTPKWAIMGFFLANSDLWDSDTKYGNVRSSTASTPLRVRKIVREPCEWKETFSWSEKNFLPRFESSLLAHLRKFRISQFWCKEQFRWFCSVAV